MPEETIEEKLVRQFIERDSEVKFMSSQLQEKKKALEEVEAELLDLLDDENKKSSGKFIGVGHVTALEPRVGQAYIFEDKKEEFFEYLHSVGRQDLIKTNVHHTSLAVFIGQQLKAGQEAPPGVGYIFKQKLRAYPEKGA